MPDTQKQNTKVDLKRLKIREVPIAYKLLKQNFGDKAMFYLGDLLGSLIWPSKTLLIYQDQKLIGLISYRRQKLRQVLYIAVIAINKDYRRRGIGRHVVLKIARALRREMKTLKLIVPENNSNLKQFGKSLGLKEYMTKPNYYGVRENGTVMQGRIKNTKASLLRKL